VSHDVEVIAHYRVGGDVDGEHRSELLQTLKDPAAPVLEVPAGAVIEAAEIRAPDTARDHVVPGGGVEGDEGGARLRHARTPSMESGLRKGYRGGARRSSNVGVTESPPKGCRGAAERSSKVGVPVVGKGNRRRHAAGGIEGHSGARGRELR